MGVNTWWRVYVIVVVPIMIKRGEKQKPPWTQTMLPDSSKMMGEGQKKELCIIIRKLYARAVIGT